MVSRATVPAAECARSAVRRGLVLLGIALLATTAAAERGWVKDELNLNLRSGPGTQFRILDSVKTGDQVEIIMEGDGWTQIRKGSVEGWIPAGFLQPMPPAGMRLERSRAQAEQLEGELGRTNAKVEQLTTRNEELAQRDESQRSEIEILTRENMELKAGARWPEWVTGAGILAVGMLMGAILQSISGRRSRPRIRL